MAYINKSYLSTQFTNFATKISSVFAKKNECGYSLYIDTATNQIQLKSNNGTVLSTQTIPKLQWK